MLKNISRKDDVVEKSGVIEQIKRELREKASQKAASEGNKAKPPSLKEILFGG